MKFRFYAFVVLLITGSILAGYSSGRYNGLREARVDTHGFLEDFMHATDMEKLLEQHGQKQWIGRLKVYGFAGPDSYLRALPRSWNSIMIGLVCIGAGLAGLIVTARPSRTTPRAERP